MKVYFIVIFFILLNWINSLYIYIEPKEKKCITDFRQYNESIRIMYYVSGQQEESNIATIEDNDGNILSKVKNRKKHKYKYMPEKEGQYKFCFKNLAKSRITLSFELNYSADDSSAISIRTIENFVNVVTGLEKKFKMLQFNIRNSAVRKRAHFDIAESIRKKINIYALIKIGFLIAFTIFQLMMLTSIFTNVKIVKQINVNSERRPLKYGKKDELNNFL